jgi:hypothetical protein
MTPDEASSLLQALVGRACNVERREADWNFYFGDRVNVSASVPWRVVAANGIAHGDEDDRQLFGLSQPIDGASKANELLAGRAVVAVELDGQTADLRIRFDGNTRLDLFNNSAGYEGWQASLPSQGTEITVIALGGGGLTAWSG